MNLIELTTGFLLKALLVGDDSRRQQRGCEKERRIRGGRSGNLWVLKNSSGRNMG